MAKQKDPVSVHFMNRLSELIGEYSNEHFMEAGEMVSCLEYAKHGLIHASIEESLNDEEV